MLKGVSVLRIVVASICLAILSVATLAEGSSYHVTRTFPLGQPASWDYTAVDPVHRRLLVSHGDVVDVLDLDSGKIAGRIPNTLGVRGIAVAPDLGRGFIACNHTDSVTVIDLSTLAAIGNWKTGHKPDDVAYDVSTGFVLSFNHDLTATVFDAKNGTVKGTIPLGGGPEYAVSDGKGKLYVNLQNTNEVVQVDPRTLKVDRRWPVKSCEAPTSLGIDPKSRRLFIGCHNLTLVVTDADSGETVQTLPIGPGVDGTVFDALTGFIFTSSGGDGTLTVVHEEDANHFTVVGVVKTFQGARTIALDPSTNKLYLPVPQAVSEFGDKAATETAPKTLAVIEVGR
jgi:DNA-binding beta-propeller fold protein YncE